MVYQRIGPLFSTCDTHDIMDFFCQISSTIILRCDFILYGIYSVSLPLDIFNHQLYVTLFQTSLGIDTLKQKSAGSIFHNLREVKSIIYIKKSIIWEIILLLFTWTKSVNNCLEACVDKYYI